MIWILILIGGFGSYLLAMTEIISKQSTEATDPQNTKSLSLGWIIGFLFIVSFVGLFSVVPFWLTNIVSARKQVKELGKFLSFSFLWGFFQWFFTAGDDCGFISFPSFGLKAYKNKYLLKFLSPTFENRVLL